MPATPAQHQEIIRLLNMPVITRYEKTKVLLRMHKFSEQRAQECIDNLNKALKDRE